MYDPILKSATRLFIGETFLKCVSVESIAWKDERSAIVQIEGLYSQKDCIDLIVDGVTIDLMCLMCSNYPGDRQNRKVHQLVLSMIDIYDVEKVIWNPVINTPNDEGNFTISAIFCCSLEFADD